MSSLPAQKCCPTCHDLQRTQFKFHPNDLQSSCEICLTLKTATETLCTYNDASELVEIDVTMSEDNVIGLQCGLWDIELKKRFGGGGEFQIFTHQPHLNNASFPWPNVGVARTVQAEAITETSLKAAKSWLNRCLQFHKCGPNTAQANWLPKRLLYVGNTDDSPRLCISEDMPHVQYLALSHCWGTHVPLRTTKASLTAHQKAISLQKLPKTFQDAFRVTEGLGFQYIWIDSLCIVQDSAEDWNEEAPKMGGIYENAVLTISADVAHDGSVGLSGPHRTAYSSVPVWKDVLFASRLGCVYNDPSNPSTNIEAPLQTRAWTLQEKILSRRILHFDVFETTWECRSSMECECEGPWDEKRRELAYSKTVKFPQEKFQTITELLSFWGDLVTEYTQRNLTYPSDLLPAVAGIASTIAGNSPFTYLSGLWKECLAPLLLWKSLAGGARHNKYYCPTWSWASVIGPVRYRGLKTHGPTFPVIQVHSAICRHKDDRRFAPPESGYLAITAPVASVVPRDSGRKWVVDMPWQFVETKIHPDIAGWSEFDLQQDIYFLVVGYSGTIVKKKKKKKKKTRDDTTTTTLPDTGEQQSTSSSSPQSFYGLVVARLPGENSVYRRIGYCEYLHRSVPVNESYVKYFTKTRLTLR